MNPAVHYITHWYSDANTQRRCELAQTIGMQLSDPHIISAAIVAGVERPTFQQLVMQHSRDDADVVNMLTNTDCFVDPADMPLLQSIQPNEVWCLSRTDNCNACSQDVWVWRGAMDVKRASYPQGVPGCDSRFAFDCAVAGRIPSNPSLSIKVFHTHASGRRTYSEQNRLSRPYLFVKPTKLGDPPCLRLQGGDLAERGSVSHLTQYYGDIKV